MANLGVLLLHEAPIAATQEIYRAGGSVRRMQQDQTHERAKL
ncbi:MAG: hypothetical protein ACK5U4_14115 [Rhodospirillales bacterium]